MRFVQNYANITAPLTELTRKQYKHDSVHYWKQQHDIAFDQLVHMLTSRPILQLFDEDRLIRIESDASNLGMGAVLLQHTPYGQWKPVEFWSKKFSAAQRNYHPAEKETCAIVYALQHWRHLLFGQVFTVVTDKSASAYLQTKSLEQLSPRDQQWVAKLAYFAPFQVAYRPGPEKIRADYLSRQGTTNDSPVTCILDLCAGTGTVLRALWNLLPASCPIQVDYIAVEMDPNVRSVIRRVFADVNLDRPGMFLRTDVFPYENDVRHVAHRRKLPKASLLIASVPCQPFSRANNSEDYPSQGLRDPRELFTAVHQIYERAHRRDYIIKCTPFAALLQQDFKDVSLLFGDPTLHNLAEYCP